MNYHEWAKTASPYSNSLSPEITCSTCIECNREYQRDDNKFQFDPLRCPSCYMKHISCVKTYHQPNIGHLDSNNGQYLDSPLGGIFGAISSFLN